MSVPTFTQSPNYNYSPQPRKSRTWLWIVLGSAIGVLLFSALVAGSAFFALHTFFQQTDQPVPVVASSCKLWSGFDEAGLCECLC